MLTEIICTRVHKDAQLMDSTAAPTRVSQRQIADLAKVSRTTVTRALANDPRISQEVTRRVRRIAREHGYRPNAAARSIATQRNNCIGVVLCDRSLMHSHYGRQIAGIEHATREAGMRLQLSLFDSSQIHDDELPPMFEEVGVDGVILMGSVSEWLLHRLKHWMMPVVLAGSQAGVPGVDQVTGDPYASSVCMTEHLLGLGHRRIGLLIGPRGNSVHGHYAQGFVDTMVKAGIDVEQAESDIQETPTIDVIEPVRSLFAKSPDLTAIFADTDIAAWQTMQYLRAIGKDVPGDISIAGSGGGTGNGGWPVTLTSVDVGLEDMAQSAVEMMISSINSRRAGSKRIVVQPHVVQGQTSGPPRSK